MIQQYSRSISKFKIQHTIFSAQPCVTVYIPPAASKASAPRHSTSKRMKTQTREHWERVSIGTLVKIEPRTVDKQTCNGINIAPKWACQHWHGTGPKDVAESDSKDNNYQLNIQFCNSKHFQARTSTRTTPLRTRTSEHWSTIHKTKTSSSIAGPISAAAQHDSSWRQYISRSATFNTIQGFDRVTLNHTTHVAYHILLFRDFG